MAKTIDYFKKNEVINVEMFKEDVFGDEQNKKLFENHKEGFETDRAVLTRNQFDVSEIVLK